MHRFASLVAAGLVLAACSDSSSAPSDGSPPLADRDTITAEMAASRALSVGDRAPNFALTDLEGRTVRLSSLLADGPVVLTFYRGAWCPYCNTQLRDYQQALDAIESTGATLIAVSPQTPDGSLTMQEQNALTFPVLSDVGNEVSRAYGLVFQVDDETRQRYEAVGIDLEAINGTDAWELPVPATFVIDPSGVVRFAFVEADYTQRASPRDVLGALERLG